MGMQGSSPVHGEPPQGIYSEIRNKSSRLSMSGKRLSGLINPRASYATMMLDLQRGINNMRQWAHLARLQLSRSVGEV